MSIEIIQRNCIWLVALWRVNGKNGDVVQASKREPIIVKLFRWQLGACVILSALPCISFFVHATRCDFKVDSNDLLLTYYSDMQ